MPAAFDFSLNGKSVRVEGISPNCTLLEFLRARGLTGTKEGCAEGDCGACSVVVVDRDPAGQSTYRAINSCLIPICLLAGREVISVEGLASGSKLHPVQTTMVECYGSQCGYCTPGFVMSMFEGYYRDDLTTREKIDDQLCGNLCRCTGYRSIRQAMVAAGMKKNGHSSADLFAARLTKPSPPPDPVTYEALSERFFRPFSLAELFELLESNPAARVIAGGTELGLEITKRFKKFPVLVSLEAIRELKGVEKTDSAWRIGGAATLTDIDDTVGEEFPVVRDMLRVFGSRQIRNRATMGGNIVTASPIGDSAPVLLALNAKIVLASKAGERALPIEQFFLSYRQTALRPGEILKSIILPRDGPASGHTRVGRWCKVTKRREMDISTVAACFVVEIDSSNKIQHARLAYGGVAPTPVRATGGERALLGQTWSEQTVVAVLPILRQEFAPISDIRGSAAYRRELVGTLFEKFYARSANTIVSSVENASRDPLPPAAVEVGPQDTPHALPHESAHKHVTGEAIYTDDAAVEKYMLEIWPVCSPHARARIITRQTAAARETPGVSAVLLAEDIPGLNDVGAVRQDEILLADKEISFHGQLVALVVGEDQEKCRSAAAKVVVEYEALTPILQIEEAIAQDSFHTEPHCIRRGDIIRGWKESAEIIEGEFSCGGQEHFYLEMQAAWAEPGEDGSMLVVSSTQHPAEVQHVVAHVLQVPVNHVVVQSPRMGGAFGGKETQAATFAALAALAARKTNQPVRVRVNRDLDMMLTGKRHPFLAKYRVGFSSEGLLMAAKIDLYSNGGWSLDLSQPVMDRALFHLDNAYYIPNVEVSGRVVKTNVASNTAFRGFGGPQGMLVIEEIIEQVAHRLGLPPEMVRERNLYRGTGATNTTHYGQEIADNRIERVWHELKASSRLAQRREEIAQWNQQHSHQKRGLAMTPVKFGISFTLAHLNQAGALVLIYQDGTVQVNHGGTEMGQGVHTNVTMIAARELGVSADKVRIMTTSTDKVPNTSATAASCGTDLNGMAVRNACQILRERLAPVAAALLSQKLGRDIPVETIVVANNWCSSPAAPSKSSRELSSNQGDRCPAVPNPADAVTFCEVVTHAYFQRISLSSTGYYRTPEIHYDRVRGQGKPFHYFSLGAAVTEVEVDGFTGMMRVLRTDILQDVGDSINPGINRGQIEGGFVQGMGWLTCEQLVWNEQGQLLTHSPDTYKIPASGDSPEFHVSFLTCATQPNTIFGSKAVGEPPLMLALSVRGAIRDAIAAFGHNSCHVDLPSPATAEGIFHAIQRVKSQSPKARRADPAPLYA